MAPDGLLKFGIEFGMDSIDREGLGEKIFEDLV
jgi:hypothetical protein